MHTSDHCDPYTSKSGSAMQARHAKVNNCHDHAATHRYRQSMLDKLASSKHAVAHKLCANRSKFTANVADAHRLSDDSDFVKHISYDSSISNVALNNKDNSKSDDETRHYNSRTNLPLVDHCFSPSGAKGASRAKALNSVNSASQMVELATWATLQCPSTRESLLLGLHQPPNPVMEQKGQAPRRSRRWKGKV